MRVSLRELYVNLRQSDRDNVYPLARSIVTMKKSRRSSLRTIAETGKSYLTCRTSVLVDYLPCTPSTASCMVQLLKKKCEHGKQNSVPNLDSLIGR